ncbi:poly-beta-1,6 N-acetyl-D-glucosamine synthase, partial [Aeromonas veronii]
CLLQFGVSIFIDHHYDKSMARSFIWCVWYPLIYWLLNLVTLVVAVPNAILRRRGQLAVWESPDRGESFRDKT